MVDTIMLVLVLAGIVGGFAYAAYRRGHPRPPQVTILPPPPEQGGDWPMPPGDVQDLPDVIVPYEGEP